MIRDERIQYLMQFATVYTRLQRIAKRLHKYFEIACERGLTPRQERRVSQLIRDAHHEVATIQGLKLYVNGDPRGLPLYLIPSEWGQNDAQGRYIEGIPIRYHHL